MVRLVKICTVPSSDVYIYYYGDFTKLIGFLVVTTNFLADIWS
jgi:hypothetical protein